MLFHLRIIGILLILLALTHIIFPRYFKWRQELKTLSLINRQMMTVHTFYIALVVFLMGMLCLTSAPQLVETELGLRIVLGLFIFWTSRLGFQFFVYSNKLWKGKRFETTIHILFSLMWMYFSIVFAIILFS